MNPNRDIWGLSGGMQEPPKGLCRDCSELSCKDGQDHEYHSVTKKVRARSKKDAQGYRHT